jgi:hypothetical protein
MTVVEQLDFARLTIRQVIAIASTGPGPVAQEILRYAETAMLTLDQPPTPYLSPGEKKEQ